MISVPRNSKFVPAGTVLGIDLSPLLNIHLKDTRVRIDLRIITSRYSRELPSIHNRSTRMNHKDRRLHTARKATGPRARRQRLVERLSANRRRAIDVRARTCPVVAGEVLRDDRGNVGELADGTSVVQGQVAVCDGGRLSVGQTV